LAEVGQRVYWGRAPRGAIFPYVVLSLQGGTNAEALEGERLAQEPRYLIKVIDEAGDPEVSGRVFGKVDAALKHAQGSITLDGVEYWVSGPTQETPVDYVEDDPNSDVSYQHTGGIYRLFVEGVT
jgi:hypothetical protein